METKRDFLKKLSLLTVGGIAAASTASALDKTAHHLQPQQKIDRSADLFPWKELTIMSQQG